LILFDPTGDRVRVVPYYNGVAKISHTALETGTYTASVRLDGAVAAAMHLHRSPARIYDGDVDGDSVRVTVSVPGQDSGVKFDASAGQRLSVTLTDATIAAYAGDLVVAGPDGYRMTLPYSGTAGVPAARLLFSPRVSGTYMAWFVPDRGATASGLVTISSSKTYEGEVDGTAIPVTTERLGQTADVFFASTAGDQLSIAVSDSTAALSAVVVYDPSGNVVRTATASGGTAVARVSAPSSGTYRAEVRFEGGSTGSATVTITRPVALTAEMNGDAVPVIVEKAGQVVYVDVQMPAQAPSTVNFTSNGGSSWTLKVVDPSGATLRQASTGVDGARSISWTTTAAGGYRFELSSTKAAPMTGSIRITSP
jgi:hypothetical protein